MLTIEDIIKSVKEDVQKRIKWIELHGETVNEIVSYVAVGTIPDCYDTLLEIAKQSKPVANWYYLDEPQFWDTTSINMIKSSIFEFVVTDVQHWFEEKKEK